MVLLKVRSRRMDGFWRAKRKWPREWTKAELNDDDALAVMQEPNLECEEIKPEQGSGLKSIEEVQPGLPPEPIVPFADPKLREKQKERLEDDAEKERDRKRHRGPDLGDESLPREPVAPKGPGKSK